MTSDCPRRRLGDRLACGEAAPALSSPHHARRRILGQGGHHHRRLIGHWRSDRQGDRGRGGRGRARRSPGRPGPERRLGDSRSRWQGDRRGARRAQHGVDDPRRRRHRRPPGERPLLLQQRRDRRRRRDGRLRAARLGRGLRRQPSGGRLRHPGRVPDHDPTGGGAHRQHRVSGGAAPGSGPGGVHGDQARGGRPLEGAAHRSQTPRRARLGALSRRDPHPDPHRRQVRSLEYGGTLRAENARNVGEASSDGRGSSSPARSCAQWRRTKGLSWCRGGGRPSGISIASRRR